MIRCIVVDDEFDAVDVLVHYIRQLPDLKLIGTYNNPIEALRTVSNDNIDLIFLDIQMPQLSGIDFVKATAGNVRFILTTAYSEFAVESYNLDVIDYLLKPIPFPRFVAAVSKASNVMRQWAQTKFDSNGDDFIFVKTESKGRLIKVELGNIDYIEAANNYVSITQSGKKTLVHTTMKELEEKLGGRGFIRVHKSFIVPIKNILGIEGNKLILKHTNPVIVVGESYKPALMNIIGSRLID